MPAGRLPGAVSVSVTSSRFGALEIDESAVLTFPRGLIGLGGQRYAIVAPSEDDAIVWLHSLEDPDLAVPVADPWTFFPGYEVELSDEETERVGAASPEETRVLVIVRVGPTAEECFANLRAPLLLAHGTGHQVINEAAEAPLRAPLVAGAAE